MLFRSVSRACLNGTKCMFLENNDDVNIDKSGQLFCTESVLRDLYWIELGVASSRS